MPDFNAKMHQNRFRLGSAPDPAGGAYSTPPDPVSGFKGPTSKGRGARPVCLLVLTILATGLGWEVGRGRGREEGGRERDGGEGRVSWSWWVCEILNTPLN